MKAIRRILAAVDFSGSSNFAFKMAVDLAKLFSGELHVVHAFEPAMLPFTSYAPSLSEPFVREARDVVARKLDKSCQMATRAGVDVKYHLGTGPAAGAVVGLAREIGADLIVMGTRGHTGFKHLLLGSVAERTVREAPCAVLTVKKGGVAARRDIERIIVALDFSEYSDRALDVAVGFAQRFGAELHLVHAVERGRIPVLDPYELAIPTALIEEARRAAASKLGVLVEKVASEGVTATPQLRGRPAASAIVDLAEGLGADLIVMGTRGHTGLKHVVLGSVAERTLRHAPCSVLTVKGSSG